MAPGVMVTVSKSEKVFWIHVGKTEDNFISENRIMPQGFSRILVCARFDPERPNAAW